MENESGEERSLPEWFFPAAAAGIVLFSVILYLLVRPDQEPGQAVENYVDALAAGKCSRAYRMVTPFAKDYYLSYRTYGDFSKNVCDKVKENFKEVYVHEVDDVRTDTEGTRVYFRLRFKTKWTPRKQDKPMYFKLVKKGRKWLIDGPALEL